MKREGQKKLPLTSSHKKKDYELKNIKGFNDPDDALFFRNLQNRWNNPYTEKDILSKNMNFGEGTIVFNDGQKYTVKKENDHKTSGQF